MDSLVSVIVPVYNVEKYLRKCLESLEIQTHQNFEVLLINNNSTDGSVEICEEFCQIDARFHLHQCRIQGLAAARNYGLSIAQGEYIVFVDSDDWVAPTYIKTLLTPLVKYSFIDVSHCAYYRFISEKRTILKKAKRRTGILGAKEFLRSVFSIDENGQFGVPGGQVWNKMFRKSTLGSTRFRTDVIVEDEHFFTDLAERLSFVYYVNEPLYFYRLRGDSLSSNDGFFVDLVCGRCELLQEQMTGWLMQTTKIAVVNSSVSLADQILKNKLKVNEKNYAVIQKCLTKAMEVVLSDEAVLSSLPSSSRYSLWKLKLANLTYFVVKIYQECHLNSLLAKCWSIRGKLLQRKKLQVQPKQNNTTVDESFSLGRVIAHQQELMNLHTKVFEKYKGVHSGKDIVIVATGKTLSQYIPIKNAIHIGVNKAVRYKNVRFDYLFIQDYSGGKEYIDEINTYETKFAKFYGRYLTEKLTDCIIPEFEMELSGAEKYFTTYPEHYFTADIMRHGLADYRSVVFAALSFALWTRPKRIYLVGCDCSNVYFDGLSGKSFNFLTEGWRKARDFAFTYYPDTEIISINPVALKGLFRDMEITENNKTSEANA